MKRWPWRPASPAWRDDAMSDRIGRYLELRGEPDWAALTAAATESTFTEAATEALVRHDNCPSALRDALFAVWPRTVAEHAAVDSGLFGLPCGPQDRPFVTARLIERLGVDSAESVREVLNTARPAWAALYVLHPRYRRGDPDLRAVLRELVRDLGTDPRAWRAAWELLAEFDGPVTELLSAATGAAPDWDVAFPDELAMADDGSGLHPVESAFVSLLDAADDGAHSGLLPVLPTGHLLELFADGSFRPEWIDIVLDAGNLDLVDAVARHNTLDESAVDALSGINDVDVIIALLHQAATPDRLREYWLSQPTPELVARLSDKDRSAWRARDYRWCQPELQAVWARSVGWRLPDVAGRIPQLEAALAAWRDCGRDGMSLLLPYLSHRPNYSARHAWTDSYAVLDELVSRTDPESGRDELEQLVRHGTSPQGQIALWRAKTGLSKLADESHRWHWDAILAEHRRLPFAPDAVHTMSRIHDCPDAIETEGRTILPTRTHRGFTSLMRGEDPVTVLRAHPAGEKGNGHNRWVEQALSAGRLDFADVLSHAYPAGDVLGMLYVIYSDARTAEVGELARRYLGTNTDAWLLALRMLPDFGGSVAELLSTAAAAAGTPKG